MRVDELKNKILQLAIQGKLVPQDENDIPASVLLEEIKKEKEKLIREKKIKKEKPLPEITEEEKPFELPKGWEWVRLGEIGYTNIGLTYSPKDVSSNGTPVLRSTNIQNGKIDLNDLVYVKGNIPENKMCKRGDILICARNGSKRLVGKCAIINEEEMSFGAFMAIYRSQYNKYINLVLNSELFRNQLEDSNTVTINQITQEMLKKTICPLPSVAEQLRIVEKVDELFAIIDELAENKEAMLKNISDIRNKVLQLAIQGKLVEQNPEDTPASVLLEEIRKEKEQLIKEKKIKKEKPLPEIIEEEKLFDLPKGWEWVRLGDISKIISKGTTPKGGKSAYIEEGIRFLRVENITNDYNIDLSNIKLIYEKTHIQELKRSIAEENDLLISIAGTLGRVAVLRREHLPCNMNQAISFVRMFYSHINIEFFKYVVDSPIIKKSMIEKTKTTAQPNLTLEIISNLVIPLPSVAEQLRIVQKVDELFSIIDELAENKEAILKNISDMRNKVLQLAIQGKLVEQKPEDTPASVLLEEIRKEKETLIKEKKIKKEKPLPEITEEEKPFEIPKGWEWVRLGEISEKIHYGYTASSESNDTGVKFLRITDIQDNNVDWNTVPFCSIDNSKLKSCKLYNNDILIARTGGTIGKSFIVKSVEYNAVFASYLIRVKLLGLLNADYIKKFLESPLYWEQLKKKTQGTGQPNVNAVSLGNLIIPLPSVAEQQRIVQKVDEIMAYLDELEKTIM